MERAGEIVQSVFSGQWDIRQQRKVPEIPKQIKDMQSTEGAGAQPQQHKFQEIPLQSDAGQAGSSGASGQQRGFPGQSKNSGSSGQAESSGSSGRGSSGQAGSSGSSGQQRGFSGQAGSSGSSGQQWGFPGQSKCSASSGQPGSSGSSGQQRGSLGQAGSSGSSGQAGSSGSSGQQRGSSGQAGSSGSSGQAGSSGSSGRGSSGQAGSSSGQQQKIQDLPSPSQDNKGGELSRMNPYAGLVDCLRATWLTGKTRPMEYRQGQLEALNRFLEERRSDLLHALNQDMRRPHFEGEVAEVAFTRSEVNNALNNLSCWMKDENVSKNLATKLDCAFIRKDPYGVVVIIAPYNYPINLLLVPLVGAIAAGNCVIVKPSELARHTERLLAEALPCYLDPETFAVVTGGSEEVTKLLENQFDYIFFTGSPRVGKIIMTAAAKHLTPLTLELGGKNPCYVDKCCNFQNAANRIVWGKFFNAGQTCIAPDYVICTIETQERLMPCLRQAIREFYGECPQDSPDFGRLIDDKHFRRLRAFLECGRVAIGGESDECDRYIAPTVLADVKEWEPIMQEEVFGPILPIFTVGDLDEAIHYINRKQRPLVAYAFSCDCKVVNHVLNCTSSGNFSGNDTIIYSTLVSLPFGGIGYSGLGKYHGKFSFDTFTHQRGTLLRCMGLEAINTVRYPPYTEGKLQLLLSLVDVKRKGMCTLL
ncbi:aldehyde dehydrogenase family 3 member B1-like isoform X2 [Podarcis raffonei]|uniref:aldehyde dehydrogenase family 3 member B1-like isoform X2 n=1 Tax=Podarcis raffonei TaxID=65483 RepID=UPI0023295FD6|nr:aldehyde dehydrogenase family 3 member B1-like isoform X2 [Podarcis raffonei]